MSQRTLVLLKPDAVRRGLVGNILSRFEAKGLTSSRWSCAHIDAAQADAHYAEHVERDFYPPLRDFVTSGPLLAAVLEGDEAIEVVRATQRRDRRPQGCARHHPRRPVAVATARTSCTARTARSRPRARSRSGSPRSDATLTDRGRGAEGGGNARPLSGVLRYDATVATPRSRRSAPPRSSWGCSRSPSRRPRPPRPRVAARCRGASSRPAPDPTAPWCGGSTSTGRPSRSSSG